MQHYYGGGIVMSKDNSNFFKEKKVWSAVKDELLRCYLVPYFEKLFRTRILYCILIVLLARESLTMGKTVLRLSLLNV